MMNTRVRLTTFLTREVSAATKQGCKGGLRNTTTMTTHQQDRQCQHQPQLSWSRSCHQNRRSFSRSHQIQQNQGQLLRHRELTVGHTQHHQHRHFQQPPLHLSQLQQYSQSQRIHGDGCHHQHFQQQQQQQQQIRLQFRYYFDSRKVRKRKKKAPDPFKVLGMPEGSLYKDVKKKFLKIAMTNHPDTHSSSEGLSDDDKQKMRDKFIAARIAFESLTEDESDGTAVRCEDRQDDDSDDNFDSWFRNETGLNTPFHIDIDPETMKEVARMTEKMGGEAGGLDRDGGMWTLARMVTSAVKTGGDAATVLRLESGGGGDGANGGFKGELRRRRQRR